MHPIRVDVLAISGSLRAASSHCQLIQAIRSLAPPDVHVTLAANLDELPHFNPDLDTDPAPPAVSSFRNSLKAADAVIISSPEYAHGVPGVLKNALDWVVGSGEFMGKPVALINPSTRGGYARASLTETLQTMMAVVVPDASIALHFATNQLDAAAMAADPVSAITLRRALNILMQQIRVQPHQPVSLP